ncbi:MAG: ATP-binding protein [Anaerolineae bacterium]
MKTQTVYPFTAIVGQEQMKLALVLNVINPRIGGVLIRGEKGTAKSTAVRALADLLPEREVAQDCPFGCLLAEPALLCDSCRTRQASGRLESRLSKMRVVELPVSATEDRVVGTLDIEHTLKTGEKRFEPGVLAQANGNILYVDEVNLMDDHIVDILLDAAAMGVNFVEREGVSYTHPASFVLVGTMNPEEGDLRPQLLDRFGLVVEVTGESELEQRIQVIKRRLAFEAQPEQFTLEYSDAQNRLAAEIGRARELLPQVRLPDHTIELAARIAIELGVDGHRADITTIKTAQTLAAFRGRIEVSRDDIVEAAQLALPHRLRRRPLEDPTGSAAQLAQTLAEILK